MSILFRTLDIILVFFMIGYGVYIIYKFFDWDEKEVNKIGRVGFFSMPCLFFYFLCTMFFPEENFISPGILGIGFIIFMIGYGVYIFFHAIDWINGTVPTNGIQNTIAMIVLVITCLLVGIPGAFFGVRYLIILIFP